MKLAIANRYVAIVSRVNPCWQGSLAQANRSDHAAASWRE